MKFMKNIYFLTFCIFIKKKNIIFVCIHLIIIYNLNKTFKKLLKKCEKKDVFRVIYIYKILYIFFFKIVFILYYFKIMIYNRVNYFYC